jgi:hypothetical protein
MNPGFTPVPVPPVPPPPRRHRSIAGAFVLIIVGVFCLLWTMGFLSGVKIGHWYANYWPLLLILWGVIKVIEHMHAQREGTRTSGIGAGGILLIIAIVVSGLIAKQIDRHWAGWREEINVDNDDFPFFGGEKYNFNDNLEQSFPADASLKVINNHGAVSMHASDDNKITVVVRKRIGADSQEDADKYNSQTKPTITTIGGLVTVNANVEAAGDHPVETDLDISLPRKAPVTVVSRRGDVNISGRTGNVDVSSQHADTSIDDVTGNVKVSQEKGSVKIEQVTGDVHVDGRVNEVALADIKGSAQLDGEFQESVKLERIAKTVSFKSSRTDMEFSSINGSLDLDSDELRAGEVTGPLHLTTRSKNIRLDDVSGEVRVQDDNGTVEVGMRSLGNVQIDNRNGDVQLSVPEKSGFRLDARVHDGEIQSDFPELKVDNNDHESRATGSVGSGAAHIVINNEHDGFEIRKNPTNGGPKEGATGGVSGGVPGPKQSKGGKSLPAPKENVEPSEN